jgi:hypothetical protein
VNVLFFLHLFDPSKSCNHCEWHLLESVLYVLRLARSLDLLSFCCSQIHFCSCTITLRCNYMSSCSLGFGHGIRVSYARMNITVIPAHGQLAFN